MTEHNPPKVKGFFHRCSCGHDGPHDHAGGFHVETVPVPAVKDNKQITLEDLKADRSLREITNTFRPQRN